MIIKMLSSCAFLGMIVLMLSLNCGKSSSMNTSSNPAHSAVCPKVPVNNCNCHCNVNQVSYVSKAINALETKLEQLITLVNKMSAQQPTAPQAASISSCQEQYKNDNSSKSQVYTLKFGSRKIPVYCHMGNFGCGDGGWTLAMKIDGNMSTFHYDSFHWRIKRSYNLAAGKTGFDHRQTKLPTYWDTPFSKICLGMKVGQQIRFIAINLQAYSLYSLIADGQYRATSLGRNTWKTLIGPQASLQRNCNRGGFNAASKWKSNSKARIGILGNNENDCDSCDSRIGFGTAGNPDDSNTCGNEAERKADNGVKHLKAMGYILVQ